MKPQYYYKYRSLKNFSRFVEIILNNRLYATTYNKLDDAMEGRNSKPSGVDKETFEKKRKEKESYLICSLSKTPDCSPMWALYADEHKGCCIKLEVTSNTWQKHEVRYSNTMPGFEDDPVTKLTTKSKEWEHQQEVRFLKQIGTKTRRYLPIKISEIIFGLRVDEKEFKNYKKLIEKLNPEIVVKKLKWADAHFGYEK